MPHWHDQAGLYRGKQEFHLLVLAQVKELGYFDVSNKHRTNPESKDDADDKATATVFLQADNAQSSGCQNQGGNRLGQVVRQKKQTK